MMSDTIFKTDTKEKIKVEEPSQYDVVFINDDITPMDFVIRILQKLFGKTADEANALTMKIHKEGKGVAGTYHFEVAEQKGIEATMMARNEGFPLQIKIQKRK